MRSGASASEGNHLDNSSAQRLDLIADLGGEHPHIPVGELLGKPSPCGEAGE